MPIVSTLHEKQVNICNLFYKVTVLILNPNNLLLGFDFILIIRCKTAVILGQQCYAYLYIILGIPVGVVDDNSVGSCEVDAQPTSSSAQQKHKPIGIRLRETIDGCLSQRTPYPSIDTLIQVTV